MSAVGVYKLTKVMAPVAEPEADKPAFELITVEEQLENLKKNDPDEVEQFERIMSAHIIISEDGKMVMGIPIPADAPEEEVQRARERGRIYEEHLLMELYRIKYEGDDLYMYDSNQMLTGEEWVKISTENEGELNLIMQVYNKI